MQSKLKNIIISIVILFLLGIVAGTSISPNLDFYFTNLIDKLNKKEPQLSEPVYEYYYARKIKENINKDSSTGYSDSLITRKIKEFEKETNAKNVLYLVRVDSVSYEIIVRPYNFHRQKENFFLVTQDSIYVLFEKAVPSKKLKN